MTTHTLDNPLQSETAETEESPNAYQTALGRGKVLMEKPLQGGGKSRVQVQHSKDRMTIWERIRVLTDLEPHITYQNWGPNLDGASIVTGILNVKGRDVAVYGHDFTLNAGSMNADNGSKLARHLMMAMPKPLLPCAASMESFLPSC